MPLRDESKYNIKVEGEPVEVTEARKKILDTFSDVEFQEEGHKYFLHGVELSSVSAVAQQYEEEFDTETKAEAYAEKHGMTKEYWMDQWKYINLKATVTGTQVHSFAESLSWLKMGHPENITDDNKYKYIEDKNWLIPTRPKENSAVNFFENFPQNLHLVLPETRIYNVGEKIKYAGTFDLLTYYDNPEGKDKSGFIIMDWKTNADIYKEFSRTNGKMLFWPFTNLYQEPFGIYTLQLNLYSMALENIGIPVIGKRIIWLKDDETYEIIKVDDVQDLFKKVDPSIYLK